MRRLDLWTRYYIRWNPTMQPQVRDSLTNRNRSVVCNVSCFLVYGFHLTSPRFDDVVRCSFSGVRRTEKSGLTIPL